jgi:hypothetical protein
MDRSLADLGGAFVNAAPERGVSLADLAGAYDPLTGMPATLSPHAQGKFNRIADALVGGLRDWIATPGRAMREGITTEQAADWAAPTALGMIGASRFPGAAPAEAVGATGGRLVQPEGIRAYHGSPHDFDKFDLSKIGTGEGAQAYGHGLYFAENPGVAESYRHNLGRDYDAMRVDGRVVEKPSPEFAAARLVHNYGEAPDVIAQRLSGGGDMFKDVRGVLESWGDKAPPIVPGRGRMYEVNINAKPDQFLDWDKPLAQQPDAFKQLAKERGYPAQYDPSLPGATGNPFSGVELPPARGAELYQGLVSELGPRPVVSDALKQAGIPGIRYLDQGSRGQKDWIARHPQGGTWEHPTEEAARAFIARNPEYTLETPKISSNYVVFNPGIIDILRKYGLAGAASTGALSAAASTSEPPR